VWAAAVVSTPASTPGSVLCGVHDACVAMCVAVWLLRRTRRSTVAVSAAKRLTAMPSMPFAHRRGGHSSSRSWQQGTAPTFFVQDSVQFAQQSEALAVRGWLPTMLWWRDIQGHACHAVLSVRHCLPLLWRRQIHIIAWRACCIACHRRSWCSARSTARTPQTCRC
jgi:hypothetical protein